MENKKGFTLLELLVVVLIIGILASIALPQYRMAVTKSRVASMLPLMRRWKDAMAEYKLQHGDYCENHNCPDATTLGVNWPSNWECGNDGRECDSDNGYWYCFANEEGTGYVYCQHRIDGSNSFFITMYQSDEPTYEDLKGMMTCEAGGTEGAKVCKALGGNLLEDVNSQSSCPVYRLN